MNKFEVIIIGSGLGGLAAGVILAKEGKKVCVLEKEPHAGGCLRCFRRDGIAFDTGLHYMGSMDDGEILNRFFRYAGIYESLKLQRLDERNFDIIVSEHQRYGFAQGPEEFVERLAEDFPGNRRELETYVRSLEQVGRVIGVQKLRQGILSSGGERYLSMSASRELERQISHPGLRRILAGNALLYDGIRDKTPYYLYGMINHSYLHGACRLVDGSEQLADLLCGKIRENGGEIRCREEVTGIFHEQNRVQGVRLRSGEQLFAECVISDIHPSRLMTMIDEGSKIRNTYLRRIQGLRNSVSLFSVFLSMDKKRFPYLNSNYYLLPKGDVWRNMAGDSLPDTVLLSMQAQSPDAPYEAVSLLRPVSFERFRAWEHTSIGRRGADYEALKQQLASEMIERVAEDFPGFKAAIRHCYTASPLTYRDYTATPDGSAYGALVECDNVLETLLSPMTKLGGLYLTGQNVAMHGVLGVVMSAMATAGAVLGTEHIAKKIGNGI